MLLGFHHRLLLCGNRLGGFFADVALDVQYHTVVHRIRGYCDGFVEVPQAVRVVFYLNDAFFTGSDGLFRPRRNRAATGCTAICDLQGGFACVFESAFAPPRAAAA